MAMILGALGLAVVAAMLGGQQAALQDAPPGAIDQAFVRLYNFDFPGAHRVLDEHARADPSDPLTCAVRAGAYLFSEFDRLRILETEYFLDDDNIIDDRPVGPDAALRVKLNETVAKGRALAAQRLASNPNDKHALFTMCMIASVVTDYTGLVERRRWRSVSLARENKRYADRLLALSPPVYDAYLTVGTLEYVVGSLPFFVRWFVHYDGIDGDKRKGIEALKLVALHGRYYGPFARVLLSVISLRDGKLEDARQLLDGLTRQFPENPLLRRELARVTARIGRAR